MRLARVHVDFWSFHSRPQWSRRVVYPKVAQVPPSIDACVNEHDGTYTSPASRERDNFVSLVALALKNDARSPGRENDTAAMLYKIMFRPHTTDSIHRQVWARRLVRRYYKANRLLIAGPRRLG